MGYLGTKPSNSPLTSELIPNSIITNAKINDVAATKLTGTVPDANAPSGSVIQVVSVNSSVNVSTTSATLLTLNITPSSASNRIMLFCYVTVSTITGSNTYADLRVNRNGSTVFLTYYGYSGTVPNSPIFPLSGNFVDSPNTTSSIAYTLVLGRGSGGTTSVSTSGEIYTLTAMEIAA